MTTRSLFSFSLSSMSVAKRRQDPPEILKNNYKKITHLRIMFNESLQEINFEK